MCYWISVIIIVRQCVIVHLYSILCLLVVTAAPRINKDTDETDQFNELNSDSKTGPKGVPQKSLEILSL